MTLEKQIRQSLLLHPSIFPNRWAVLHHLFIVNGNGYEWQDGELIDPTDQPEPTMADIVDKHFDFYLSDRRLINSSLGYSRDACKDAIKAMFNIEERIKDMTPTRDKLYPICGYAKILHVPQDVKPDWLEAAKGFYDHTIQNFSLSKEEKSYFDQVTFPS